MAGRIFGLRVEGYSLWNWILLYVTLSRYFQIGPMTRLITSSSFFQYPVFRRKCANGRACDPSVQKKLKFGKKNRPSYTVKPRPEAHMHMIRFEVFLKNIHLIPQDQMVHKHS